MKEEDPIQRVLLNLEKNHFNVTLASDRENARKIILDMIPSRARIGIGDSATLRQVGIIEELEKRRIKVLNPFVKELTTDFNQVGSFEKMLRKSITGDLFLAGTNAVTLDGKLVNMDRVGNRVAGIIFGPKKVILAVGRNKIVSDVDQAIHRIKNVIAPAHARHKRIDVPCARSGFCADCHSPDRGCNIIAILEKKPSRTDITVVFVNEDLGLGWDPLWPEERKRRIESEYAKVSWEFVGLKYGKRINS